MADPLSQEISADAMRRLARLGTGKRSRPVFSSDLSVDEFLLVEQTGFRPLGLVLGSSLYHLGIQRSQWSLDLELEEQELSGALYDARDLAMTGMAAEAGRLGADGIVGVRLKMEFRDHHGTDIAEVTALGTAVNADDTSVNWRDDRNRPFTSALNGQDFWTLIQAGYAPLGMVMGICVYDHDPGVRSSLLKALDDRSQGTEISELTQALYDARELAMSRMQAGAQALDAEGVTVDRLRHSWGYGVMELRHGPPGPSLRGPLSGQDFVKLVMRGWFPVG